MRSQDLLGAHRRHWPETLDTDVMWDSCSPSTGPTMRLPPNPGHAAFWQAHGLTPAGFDVLATCAVLTPP